MRRLRAQEQHQLRARHLTETAQWRAVTTAMQGTVATRARADVAARFGYQWAILLADRAAPDFLAKVAALQAQEEAAIAARIAELAPLVTTQRMAARRLMADRQRRERAALRHKWQTLLPGAVAFPIDDFERHLTAAWWRVVFHAASRPLTRPRGVRLVWKRRPGPAAQPRR